MAVTLDLETPTTGFIDVSADAIVSAAVACEFPVPLWVFPNLEGDEELLASTVERGRADLMNRGLARMGSAGPELDSYLVEIVRMATHVSIANIAIASGDSVEWSWLFSEPAETAVLSFGDGGSCRARIIPTDLVVGALAKLAGLDVEATPSEAFLELDAAAIGPGGSTEELEDLLEGLALQRTETEMLRNIFRSGMQVGSVVSVASSTGVPKYLTWISSENGIVQINYDSESTFALEPRSGEEILEALAVSLEEQISSMA